MTIILVKNAVPGASNGAVVVDRALDGRRSDYPYQLTVVSGWEDNDMLCHVNNAVFLIYFQQAFVKFLNEEGGIDWFNDPVIPFAAESDCRMLRPLSYPDVIDVAIRVETLGNSSVTYCFALFRQGDDMPAACGQFVHAYVDRKSQRPAPIPAPIRTAYERIQVAPIAPH